jgi:hypothetical protein
MRIRRAQLDAIRRGEVDLAFRRWRRPTVQAGVTLNLMHRSRTRHARIACCASIGLGLLGALSARLLSRTGKGAADLGPPGLELRFCNDTLNAGGETKGRRIDGADGERFVSFAGADFEPLASVNGRSRKLKVLLAMQR